MILFQLNSFKKLRENILEMYLKINIRDESIEFIEFVYLSQKPVPITSRDFRVRDVYHILR